MEPQIEKILNKVRPYIQMHGGDVRLLSAENGVVKIGVYGMCTHCSLAELTYNKMVGGLLKEEIPEIRDIVFEMQD